MHKHWLHSILCCKKKGGLGRAKRSSAVENQLSKSFLFPELYRSASGPDVIDAALILSSLSLPLTHFYPNPFLSLPNRLSLFAYLHLPAHCYSLLPATPFLVHYIMFMWCPFQFLYLRYPLQWTHPTPPISLCDDCTNAFIGIVYCLPLWHLSAIWKINYLSNKTLNSKSSSVLCSVSA